jgi:hypothetical protein
MRGVGGTAKFRLLVAHRMRSFAKNKDVMEFRFSNISP